jgi:hypothetical protein
MKEHFRSNRDEWSQNWETPVLKIQMDYLKSIMERIEPFVEKQAKIFAENPYTVKMNWRDIFDAY